MFIRRYVSFLDEEEHLGAELMLRTPHPSRCMKLEVAQFACLYTLRTRLRDYYRPQLYACSIPPYGNALL